jgi:phosphatidylglycerophosphatase C
MSASAARLERPYQPHRDVAIFDLDGTLTRRDTLLPFLRFTVGDAHFFLKLPFVAVVVAAMALGLLGRSRAKELVLRAYLGGMKREELVGCGRRFAAERLPHLLRAKARERVAWHQLRHHRCVLATASLALYVAPWARSAGFHDVVATELEFDAQGRFTGALAGDNCQGAAKLERIEALLGNLANLSAYGYGDSAGDRPFLGKCAQASYRPFRDEGNRPADFLRLMRPHQWAKNAFVFVGVLFGHAWNDPARLQDAILAN